MLAIILASSLTAAMIGPNDSACAVFDNPARRATCEARVTADINRYVGPHATKVERAQARTEAEFEVVPTMMAEPAIAAMDKVAANPQAAPDAVMGAIGTAIGEAIVQQELQAHPYSLFSLRYKTERCAARLWARIASAGQKQ